MGGKACPKTVSGGYSQLFPVIYLRSVYNLYLKYFKVFSNFNTGLQAHPRHYTTILCLKHVQYVLKSVELQS